jgi:hypothetical protein
MSRALNRTLLAAFALASVAGFAYAANPRIVAWNLVVRDANAARQRAATCKIMARPLALGMPALWSEDSQIRMPAGTQVCDRFGNTGQVSRDGLIEWLASAPEEELNKILATRGLGTRGTASPTPPSPIPPSPSL